LLEIDCVARLRPAALRKIVCLDHNGHLQRDLHLPRPEYARTNPRHHNVARCSLSARVRLAVLVLLAAAVQQMMPSPPVTCVGIDLGTTFSCVAIFDDGEIVVIPNSAGQSITPSVVFVPAHNGSHPVDQVFVGDSARPTAATMPGALLYDAKRFIGKKYDGMRVVRESVGLPFDLTPVSRAALPA